MTLKTTGLTALSLIALAACGGADGADVAAPEEVTPVSATPAPLGEAASMLEDGAVVLTVDRTISEDAACLVMMSVVNGLDEPANAGIFAFNVTGNGESVGGNMFPQTADPGETATAQIVLPGSDCADVQVIRGGQVNCTLPDSGGESCLDDLVIRDSVVEFDVDVEPLDVDGE